MKKTITILSVILGIAALAATIFGWSKYGKTKSLAAQSATEE